MRRILSFVLLASMSSVALAAGWAPAGLADGGRVAPYGAVATHPTAGGQAMISAGFVSGVAQLATYFTADSGAHWSTNARVGGFGIPLLAGTPTYVFLDDAGYVQRSTDLGRTWSPVPLPASPQNTSFQLWAVNPANPGELVGSAGALVFQTIDAGATWSQDAAPATVHEMSVDWSTRRLYVSFNSNASLGHRPLDAPGQWGVGGNDPYAFAAGHGVVIYRAATGDLFRSTDGGTVFVPVAQALAPLPICDFAFARSPSQRVYAAECESGRILRSDDDGATWATAATLEDAPVASPAVDAGNPDHLYVMTSRGTVLSEDGAASFDRFPRATGAPGEFRLLFFDAVSSTRQWLSSGRGAPGSILRSDDGGSSWSDIGASYRLLGASRSRTNTLFGVPYQGSSDGFFSVSTNGGATWAEKIPYFGTHGTIFGPLAFGQAPGELFVAAFSASLGNQINRDVFYSNDDGESFTQRFQPPVSINALAVTPSGPMVVYAGGSPLAAGQPQLFRSSNAAITWQPFPPFPSPLSSFGGTFGNTVNAIAIDPANPARIYVGFSYPDYVMRSDDAGATWVRATSGLGAGPITSLIVDPSDPTVIYASQNGSGVFRSADHGATWTAMDEGLHDEVVLGVVGDPRTAGRVYADTGSGLYRTDLGTGVPAGNRRAIEFYHHDFNHYFVSADVDEIAGLDAGVFQGWARTGEGFRVAEGDTPGNQPVCRFFGVGFAPLSSHFYTPYPNECDIVKADPKWLYEKIAFGLALPVVSTSGCPPETRALYRLWNRNENGAPNHRYTTSISTFYDMIDEGWLFEGEASTLVFACVPY